MSESVHKHRESAPETVRVAVLTISDTRTRETDTGGDTAEEILVRAVAVDAGYSPALSALASIRARRKDYAASLDYIEKAVAAGERDHEHFERAVEFTPLRDHPKFRALLASMRASGNKE